MAPKECFFCKEKKTPHFADVSAIRKFIGDRGKIFSRSRSGMCATHQRKLTESIKHARHLALMPFVIRD